MPVPLALIGGGDGVYTDELSIAVDSRLVLQAKKISTVVSEHVRILRIIPAVEARRVSYIKVLVHRLNCLSFIASTNEFSLG